MYEKNLPNRAGLTPEFQDGVTAFIEWAKSQQAYLDGEKIRCPCRKCKNEVFKTPDEVNLDLYMKGFMLEYYNWTSHGEERVQEYFKAVMKPHLQDEQNPPAPAEEGTNRFQDVLHATEQPLWNGCTTSQLAVVAELVDIKRLYASQVTAEHMTWHANHQTEEGSMCHPSDAEAWRHFDRTHPGFCSGATPSNPKHLIDIYLEPLIEELQNLWHVGVLTRDNARDETFTMRAALKWTVNDLPAYWMASGWSFAGVMGCPICMEDTRAFYLQNAKDNLNAQKGLNIICNRPELEVDEKRPNVMPKAVYILTREQKRRICEWISRLKFSDGYASNLARCVNMKELRLHDMKSHDCHVFIQKLISIAFREMLPESVWSALIEVSLLFQIICSTTLDMVKVQELEDKVATILCNLEKIFPPSFFDSMEHLIVHLPYEPRVEGPIKYRWMYPFERSFLNELYEHYDSEDPIIEELVATQFKDWFKRRVRDEINYMDNELLKLHY
ncbi:UNVERIFIED_CONTAM: hypothetical protein Slati_3934100 [Sesamum latifolium]|uniref:Transposase n=1 Tax=Sesamum latifolium TaxID=2727402 RepID=A0AAW2TN84_9LAMI